MNSNDSKHREELLDEALDETFPASDPPANTVETGIKLDPASVPHETVTDNRAASRFEIVKDGQTAFLDYKRDAHTMALMHTEVPPALRGHHLGDRLVEAALEAAREEGLGIAAVCPFVRTYLRRHPDALHLTKSN